MVGPGSKPSMFMCLGKGRDEEEAGHNYPNKGKMMSEGAELMLSGSFKLTVGHTLVSHAPVCKQHCCLLVAGLHVHKGPLRHVCLRPATIH